MNGEKVTCLAVTVLMSGGESKQEEKELRESVNSLKSLVLIRAEFQQKIR